MQLAQEVFQKMWEQDYFSQWLSLKIMSVSEGYCKLTYQVREDMLNGFGSIHGGVLFSASDSAFAFSCNSRGIISVALDVSITFTRPAKVGDLLTVESKELHHGNKTGLYQITTYNANNELVCMFKGTAYRTGRSIL
jgi:acyl-CoA thioesterase